MTTPANLAVLFTLLLGLVPIAAPAQAFPDPSPATPPASSDAATPAPTPSPLAALRLDRGSAGVAPGATTAIPVLGGSEPIVVQSAFDAVDARYDAATHALILAGRARGSGTVTLSDATGQTATIAVLVAPPAGVVPNAVDVELGGNVARPFAMRQIRDAVVRAAQLQAGAAVELAGVTIPDVLPAGSVLDAAANVHLNGRGAWIDALGTTAVHLHVDALPPFDPALLLYSDDPEYLRADGVVFRQSSVVDATHPVRAYIYHAATVPGQRISLVLQTTGTRSRVQVLGQSVGPSTDYACVGHKATARYLEERAAGQSLVATATAGAPFVLPLEEREMAPQDLVNAIEDLRLLDGDPIRVWVVATSGSEDPLAYLAQPPLPGDGHGRKGEFALNAVRPLQLAYTAGLDDDPAFTIGLGASEGVPEFPNLLPGGRLLAGDYGVLRPVSLTLQNATSAPQTIYLDEIAGNGPVTTTIWFAGDPRPTELSPARNPSTPYLVKEFALAPNETRTVTGVYMTDGASWFPMQFTLGPTPGTVPPPNGCVS